MIKEDIKSQIVPFQTKYPCIVCLERVKNPVSCRRCKQVLCFSHIKKVQDKCPYCRLSPFQVQSEDHMRQLVNLDKKRQQQFMISTQIFTCLVPGCDFKGKYHKMDLHRRRFHRDETLRQIIFPQQRQQAMRKKIMLQFLNKLQQKNRQNRINQQLALLIFRKGNQRIPYQIVVEMIKHVRKCVHPQCKRVFIEENMSFIGNDQKQISICPQSQRFLSFY